MAAEVYKLGASLDSSNSAQEQEKILAVFDRGNSIILDMTDCTYVSSAGLRVLLYSYKIAASKGHKICLVNVCSEVRDVMGMTGFEKFFDYFDSVDECQKKI
ncbi:MAG: STAS domain-containing protein [Bacteroidales bacterium]|nr:STAS domain-containing protein [Bacteroidales bacterium]